MRYDDIAAILLQAPAEPPDPPSLPTTPARRLRDALEPIATHGWWNRRTHQRLEANGLEFFGAYVWGRAACLGEPAPAAVVATFGVFQPAFLAAEYDQARRTVGRDEVLAAREEGTLASLGEILGDVRERAGHIATTLLAAVDRLSGAGRPLFSGLRELPRPDDDLGRLWRAAELVREHRGDGHLAACVVAGLEPVEMNVLTELWLGIPLGTYVATRGYGSADLADGLGRLERRGLVADEALTKDGRKVRAAIEDATDVAQAELVAALGAHLNPIVDEVDSWSARIVAAGAFPPSPHKRAAG